MGYAQNYDVEKNWKKRIKVVKKKKRKEIMKKLLSTVLISVLYVGSVFAETHSQKTFLAPRAAGVNAAMEDVTWHHHIYEKHKGLPETIKSAFQATAFYQRSVNDEEIGKYFGIGNGRNSFSVAMNQTSGAEVTNADIDGRFFVHKNDNLEENKVGLRGKVSFQPYQETCGVKLSFFQSLNSPIENLFFKAMLPVVCVQNNLNMKISDVETVRVGNKDWSLYDFFAGRVKVTEKDDAADMQDPLTHAKIDGRRTAVGPADIDLALGYKWHQSKTKYGFVGIGMTVPTGTKPRGEYLWEAVYGNGNHFGLNLSVDGGTQLWKGDYGKVWLTGGLNYKHLFEGTEKRTLGLKGLDDGPHLAHYALAGVLEQENEPFYPLANVLTQDMRVKPGSQLEGMVDFAFKNKNFIVDCGYSLYWKDAESVWLKEKFSDSMGSITSVTQDSSNPIAEFYYDVSEENIDIDAAKTPMQLTHKLFGGLAYKFDVSDKYPTSLGLGASYEFTQDNSALEQYAFWFKVGISF